NVDGTRNALGTLKDYVTISINTNGHTSNVRFYVTDIGREEMILGLPWLKEHNPNIDWKRG
ncbi:hypothetical protein BV25DRAFT_1790333, partial [Artomyces pyxidatus]